MARSLISEHQHDRILVRTLFQLKAVDFSLHPWWQKEGKRDLWGLLYKGRNLIKKAPHSWQNYFSRAPLPNATTFTAKISTDKLVGGVGAQIFSPWQICRLGLECLFTWSIFSYINSCESYSWDGQMYIHWSRVHGVCFMTFIILNTCLKLHCSFFFAFAHSHHFCLSFMFSLQHTGNNKWTNKKQIIPDLHTLFNFVIWQKPRLHKND